MSPARFFRSVLIATLMMMATGASALDPAKDQVILTLTGGISATNAGEAAEFDRAMLEALGARTVETSTIWTEGAHTFVGVPLHDVLAALGAKGSVLKASAINDYAVEIPIGDAVQDGPIVAYLRNGDPMSVREKGPLWIIYPFDSAPEYQSEMIYSRSIWQLDRIEVQP